MWWCGWDVWCSPADLGCFSWFCCLWMGIPNQGDLKLSQVRSAKTRSLSPALDIYCIPPPLPSYRLIISNSRAKPLKPCACVYIEHLNINCKKIYPEISMTVNQLIRHALDQTGLGQLVEDSCGCLCFVFRTHSMLVS